MNAQQFYKILKGKMNWSQIFTDANYYNEQPIYPFMGFQIGAGVNYLPSPTYAQLGICFENPQVNYPGGGEYNAKNTLASIHTVGQVTSTFG